MREPESPRTTEVAIVGGGPIGLELAVALQGSGVPSVVLEAGCVGSTIDWWAPGTTFFSSPERIGIAGVPLESPDQSKTTRERYLSYLRGVARQFVPEIRTFTRVVDVRRTGNGSDAGFVLDTVRSTHGVGGPAEQARADEGPAVPEPLLGSWRARRVVLAIGDMHRPRLLNVPGEVLPHVRHYLDDPHRYYGQRVLIVGGKNSAVEAALRLHRIGCAVTISYRSDTFDARRVKYWLRPELEWLIARGMIEFLPGTQVERIDLETVTIRSTTRGSVNRVEADAVLLLTGYEQDPFLFEKLGIDLVGEERAPQHATDTMETNVPGVFVAGTAAAGTQRRARVFIENAHVHVGRIVKALGGHVPTWAGNGDLYANLEEA
ncbi:MAG: NAD(P)-binding domain-containing protein [Phycisphaerales bacterium]|nr:NAD(P)-binding domain-containing protein [Phycisphaerales bacterium]